jgi:hypothetical protein
MLILLATASQAPILHQPHAQPFALRRAGVGATAIAAGGFHTCAIRGDGRVVCWGWNDFGQLGTGAAVGVGCGAGCGAMGDGLVPVDLGAGGATGRLSVTVSRTDFDCKRRHGFKVLLIPGYSLLVLLQSHSSLARSASRSRD